MEYFLREEHKSNSLFFLFKVGLSFTRRGEWLRLGHVSAVLEPFGLSCYFSGFSAQAVAEYLVLCSWSWLLTLCIKLCFWGGTNDDIGIVLQCLDVMLAKRRKQVSQQRALAFMKRLSTLALHVLPHSSIGILATNRILMQVSFTCWIF